MRFTIIPDDGVVGVDGEFRKVDLSGIDPAVHAVQFDTVTSEGHVEFKRSATVEVDVRDDAAERAAEQAAGNDRAKLHALKPVTKKARVRRDNQRIVDFAPYQVYVERWETAPAM